MNLHHKQAFSLIEIIVVLGLMATLIGVFAASFHTNFDLQNEIVDINRAIRQARNASIVTNQPTFLVYDSGKFSIFDTFGEKISELECDLHNSTVEQSFKHGIKFDALGFFTKFTVAYGNMEYTSDILAGTLNEKKR
ncbi:MAG: type II secretion system GspH family protein [Puniceicoccales bacterium]|nr:type II secretion system GspH family protein [Puniceicoccales bacterium]